MWCQDFIHSFISTTTAQQRIAWLLLVHDQHELLHVVLFMVLANTSTRVLFQAYMHFHRTTDCFDWTWVRLSVSFQPHVNVGLDEKTPASKPVQRGDSSMMQRPEYIITYTCKCALGTGYSSTKRKHGIPMPKSFNSILRPA